MKIICWNIQKINLAKAKEFSPLIGGAITGIVGSEPFVFVVLENKTRGDDVLASIGTGLTGMAITSTLVALGGRSTVSENILLFAGNGATVTDVSAFTDWHGLFDARCEQMGELQNAPAAAREGLARAAKKVTVRELHSADAFRNPVSFVAQYGGEKIKMLALHAPGPSDGAINIEPYAPLFIKSVLESATSYDLVLGDVNLRSEMTYHSVFTDRSVLTGATTKGSEEGRHKSSRLDRTYARPGLPISIDLFTDGPGKELTDHHCMVVTTERREQREITDYFGYCASSTRRRELVQMNKINAAEARASVRDTGMTIEKVVAKHRKKTKARINASRDAKLTKLRHQNTGSTASNDDADMTG